MAKQFIATSRIEHGTEELDESGRAIKIIFERGNVVSGLTRAQMAQLWEAGVLSTVDVPDPVATGSKVSGSEPKVAAPTE